MKIFTPKSAVTHEKVQCMHIHRYSPLSCMGSWKQFVYGIPWAFKPIRTFS